MLGFLNFIIKSKPFIRGSQYQDFTEPLENFDLLCNNDILKYIPRKFTLTTNNGSSIFNILLLTKTSKYIKNIIKENPTIKQFSIEINDELNTLKQMEQLYQGNIVNFDNFPNIQEISDILEINDLKKAISMGEITFSPDFLRYCFKNNKYETFSIIFNNKIYKCNKYGVYISKVIRDFLSENPESNEFAFDLDIESDEIQPIIDYFNFSKVDINDSNIYSIKELFDKLQITSIFSKFFDEKIKDSEALNQAIDDQQTMIESIEEIFDLLYNINEITIESVKDKILQSTWIKSEENVEELAAIFLQVINNNYLLHPSLIDLLVELDNEKNASKYLHNLFQIIKDILIDSLGETKASCCFIHHLFERNILPKDQILNQVQINDNVRLWFTSDFSKDNILTRTKYLGEPIDYITNALFHDDIDQFQSVISNSKIDISYGRVNYNIFDDFIPAKNISYINYAAAYGSIKCFKYLLLNHVKIDSNTFEYAVWGGNIEIIKIVSQNYTKINEKALIPAIIKHRNDLFIWIFDQVLLNKFSSESSANQILSICASNGNARLFFEIIDKEFYYSYNYLYFISEASEKGFYKLARIIYDIFNNKITLNYISSHSSFVNFNSISIFKLFLEIVKDKKSIQKCLKWAILKNRLKLVKYFFDEYIDESFKISRNSTYHLLKHSLRKKSELTKYLINKFLNINPKVFQKFEFYHLISIACLNNDLESVKMIADLKNKYSSIKEYTDEFLDAAKSNFYEICKYFIDNKLYVDYQTVSKNAYQLKNLRKDIFLLLINDSDDQTAYLFYQSFLSQAIKDNNIELAEYILERTNKCNYDDLVNAVSTENLNMVNLIFKYDHNSVSFINQSSSFRGSPLFIAVEINNIEMVKTFLSIPKINLNYALNGKTILVYSLNNDKFEIAKLLIQDERTDINICHNEDSPLVIAAKKRKTDIISLLINNPKFDERANLLDYAFYISNNEISKQLYSLKTLDVNFYYASLNQTALEKEVYYNNEEKIDLIINHPSFDKIKSHLAIAIMVSIKKKNINIFRKLLQVINNNVNIYVTDYARLPLLTFALDQQSDEIVTEILESPNFNHDRDIIQSSFEKLCQSWQNEFTFGLMKKMVEYDEKNHHFIDFTKILSNGKSIFTSMIPGLKFDEIVKFCIDHGADPNIQDLNGLDPLSYAIELNSAPYVLALINSNKIDLTKRILDQKTGVNKTYLHFAARLNEPKILLQLLEKKEIDVNAEDDNGETPLMESCRFNRDKIIEALFKIDDLDYLHVNKNGEDALKIVAREYKVYAKFPKNDYFQALMNQVYLNKTQNDINNEEDDNIKIRSTSSDADLERFEDVD